MKKLPSKHAIRAILTAQALAAQYNIKLDLLSFFNEGLSRYDSVTKRMLWRNSKRLACLIIDSISNAIAYETDSNTLARHGFDSLDKAVGSYIENNLDCWDDRQYENDDLSEALDRLQTICRRYLDADTSLVNVYAHGEIEDQIIVDAKGTLYGFVAGVGIQSLTHVMYALSIEDGRPLNLKNVKPLDPKPNVFGRRICQLHAYLP